MSGSDVYADPTGLIVKCPSCGQKNRLPYKQLGRAARCPRCQHALTLPGEPIAIDSTAASVPPAITVSRPSSARGAPPESGASTQPMPVRVSRSCAIRRV